MSNTDDKVVQEMLTGSSFFTPCMKTAGLSKVSKNTFSISQELRSSLER